MKLFNFMGLVGIKPVLGIGPVGKKFKHKLAIIFLSISLNMYIGCSQEPSHRDGSFEYPQYMFRLRSKKNIFQLRTLIWGPTHSYLGACFGVCDQVRFKPARPRGNIFYMLNSTEHEIHLSHKR